MIIKRVKKSLVFFILFLFTSINILYADYYAEVRCNVHSLTPETSHLEGTHIYGNGNGKTKADAVKAAQKDANNNRRVPGTHIRHCHTIELFKQKNLINLLDLSNF